MIYTIYGNVRIHKSPINFLKSSGFKFIEANSYIRVRLPKCTFFFSEDGEIPDMIDTNMEEVDIISHDHDDMDEIYKELEKDFKKHITKEREIEGFQKQIDITNNETSFTISKDDSVLMGIENAWESIYEYLSDYEAHLVYLGDDSFTLISNKICVGVKTLDPCGFFLYNAIGGLTRFSLNGIGEFLKEKGFVNE